jgi:hypothetical protein
VVGGVALGLGALFVGGIWLMIQLLHLLLPGG